MILYNIYFSSFSKSRWENAKNEKLIIHKKCSEHFLKTKLVRKNILEVERRKELLKGEKWRFSKFKIGGQKKHIVKIWEFSHKMGGKGALIKCGVMGSSYHNIAGARKGIIWGEGPEMELYEAEGRGRFLLKF